jgi:hypothetical protein
VGIACLWDNCATLYQTLGFRTVTLRSAIKLNDESGGAVRLELFRYLVFMLVERLNCMMGVGG